MKTSKLFQKFVLIISLFGMNFSWGQTPTPPGSYESLEMTGNNFVSVPHNPIFNVGTPGTTTSFTGWFNICNTQNNAMLYTKHFCNNTPGHFSFVDANTGTIEFRGQIGTGCSSANLISASSNTGGLNDNQWHHFAIIVRTNNAGTNTSIRIYVDGVLDLNQLVNPGIINNTTSTAPLLIGGYRASNNNYINLPIGRYDEFQVYDYGLNQADINNIIAGNAIANNNAIFPFEGPPNGSIINNTGNTGAAGTHFTVTNPYTPNQTPFASTASYVVPSIMPVALDYCTGLQTLEAQYSDGTIADSNLVYDWQISTDGITFTPFGSGGNSANYFFPQAGTYTIVVNVAAGTSGCDQTDTVQIDIETCCVVSTGQGYTPITANTFIQVNEVWGGPGTDGKYYIDATVFVDAQLDITNCDIVFSPIGEIVVREGGFVRANNSVFRPCVINDTWRGIDFITGNTNISEASGLFNECTFKNAEIALDVQTNNPQFPVSNTNNLFKNCIVGMNVNCGSHNGNISGNTFEVDQMPLIDPATAAPFVNYAAIQIANTTFDLAISQNDFLNLDPVNKEMIGINVTNNAIVSIIQNTFSDCHHALFAADAFVNFENNDLSLSHELPFNLGLIQLTGLSSAYRISYNELISTLPYNGTTSNPFFIMEGIHVENTDNTEINANHIEGFMFGIDLVNTFNCRIYENTIVNSRRSGIITTQSTNLAVTCNVIDLQYNGTMGIQYSTTSPTNNDEIASNCFFDMRVAIGLDDQNNTGNPPYNPLPDIKNNYFYNYAQTGIAIGNLNGTIGAPGDPGRNSFFSNNGAIDVNNPAGTTVTASGNYNLSNPGPNMGAVTNNNFYNSTASCGHQEDPNNNQSLYIEEVCYNEAPFTKIVVMKDGKLKLKVDELNNYISDYGVEHTFKAVISMAEFQGEFTESLKAQLLAAVSAENQDELVLLIGLYEHDVAVVSLLNSANWEDDKSLYLKGLYELEFDGELSALTYDEMTYFIENTMSKYRNKFIALQCQSEQRFVRPYIVDTPKEQTILPSEEEGKGIYEENGFEIYPNPAGDELNLSYEVEDLEEGQLFRIYDASGQLVQEHSIQHNSSFTRIDISNLNSGVYYIEMIYSTYRPSIKEKFVKM